MGEPTNDYHPKTEAVEPVAGSADVAIGAAGEVVIDMKSAPAQHAAAR